MRPKPFSCKRTQKLLDDHVDGLLRTADSEGVRAHLEQCTPCDTEAAALRAATASLSVWGDLEPPPDCFEGILARIEALPPDLLESAPHSPALRLLRGGGRWVATSSVAAAAVVFLALSVTTPTEHDAPARTRHTNPVAAGLLSSTGPGLGLRTNGLRTNGLRTGEVRAYRVDDFLRNDGLRRGRTRNELPVSPASFGDALGAGAR